MSFNLTSRNPSRHISVKKDESTLASLRHEINHVFDQFFGDFHGVDILPSVFGRSDAVSPAIDVTESDKAITIEVELPGLDAKDIDVAINPSYVTIKGSKQQSKIEDTDNYVRRERSYGSYQRSISLPQSVDCDKGQANFTKGVLTIEIPKKAELANKTRKIDIKQAA